MPAYSVETTYIAAVSGRATRNVNRPRASLLSESRGPCRSVPTRCATTWTPGRARLSAPRTRTTRPASTSGPTRAAGWERVAPGRRRGAARGRARPLRQRRSGRQQRGRRKPHHGERRARRSDPPRA